MRKILLFALAVLLSGGVVIEAQWERTPRLIVQTRDGTVYLADGDTLDVLIPGGEDEPRCVRLSPDETGIVFRRGNRTNHNSTVYLFDFASRDFETIGEIADFGCPFWRPDGGGFLYFAREVGTTTQHLDFYDLATDTTTTLLEDITLDGFTPIIWSSDGTRVLFGAGDIFIYDLTTNTRTNLTQTPDTWERDPQWLIDEDGVVFSTRSDDVFVYQNGEITEVLPDLERGLSRPFLSPDGTQLAMEYTDEDGFFGLQIIVYNIELGLAAFIVGRSGTFVEFNAWLPDSSGVIYRQYSFEEFWSDIYHYDTTTGATVNITDDRETIESGVRIAPDGAGIIYHIAPVNFPGELKRQQGVEIGLADVAYYDFATQATRLLTDTPDLEENVVRWSPDSTYLVIEVNNGEFDDESAYLALLERETGDLTPITNFPARVVGWLE